MSMSRKKCCVPGCMESGNSHPSMHLFPNPSKDINRFNEWVYSIGSDILGLDNEDIYKHRSVCHAHFEEKYCCRFNRLSNTAIPTLSLPGSLSLPKFTFDERRPLREKQSCSSTTPSTSLSILRSCSPDRCIEKPKDGSKHVDHNYTSTGSEDPSPSEHIFNSRQSKNDQNLNLEVISDPLMGRLTHDKSDDTMVDLEDPLRERITYSKPRDTTTKGEKDPLSLNITDVDEIHYGTMMEYEDPLIEEWIEDTEINDMCDSEDPLAERLNKTSQLHDSTMADSDDTMSESDDGLLTAKYKLLELFASLDDSELDSIEQWICSKAYKKDLDQKITLLKKENMLVKISNTLKKVLPFDAELPSEKITPPTVGSQADCNEYNTCHIDEFLYDEDDVEKLVETGKVKRHYCLDCHSRNTKALTYISHSMSRQAVQYIFTVLLPKDLEDKQVLDVGSRIGAVLYGAYYFSNAGTIIGIEMNKECCDIQERIISEYSMDNNRMKIVHSDVMDRSDIVSNSDIIVINNPDFFIDIETHKKMWYFFKKHVRKGSYLVSSRSVTDTLDSLGILDELISWLSICKPHQQDIEVLFDIEDYNEIFLYAVN